MLCVSYISSEKLHGIGKQNIKYLNLWACHHVKFLTILNFMEAQNLVIVTLLLYQELVCEL